MASILIVDDDDDGREAVARFLTRAGHDIAAAPNGREALIAVASAVPDVIILDVMMPEMNGVEFLQVIRAYLRWSTVPVVLLTAYDKGRHMDAAEDLGVRHVFLKGSYELDDLLACVNRVVADRGGDAHGAGSGGGGA